VAVVAWRVEGGSSLFYGGDDFAQGVANWAKLYSPFLFGFGLVGYGWLGDAA